MMIYKVVFKNGAVRSYCSDFPCVAGDTVVADTSHGLLVAEVLEEMDQLPAPASEMRCLLCKVPVENSAEAKTAEIEKKEQADRRLARMDELGAKMDNLMKERENAIMRRIFADYCEDFSVLLDEYERLVAEAENNMSDCPELDGIEHTQYAGDDSELLIPYGYENALPGNII